MSRKYLIAGNWKMNVTASESDDLVSEINSIVGRQTQVQVCICPPFTSLHRASALVEQSEVSLGAQNMSPEPSGAFTGEISAEMLRDLYVSYVILGHSERRQFFETNDSINRKVLAAAQKQFKPIYCIGETLEEREAGKTLDIVQEQVRKGLANFPTGEVENLILAYEPVWTIGTGKTATDEMAQEVHAYVRQILVEIFGDIAASGIRILYGGSMKPEKCFWFVSSTRCRWWFDWWSLSKCEIFCSIVEHALEA